MGVEGETVVLLDEVFVRGAAGDAQDEEEPCAKRLRDLCSDSSECSCMYMYSAMTAPLYTSQS